MMNPGTKPLVMLAPTLFLLFLPLAGWAQATTYVFFEQAPPGGGDKDIMMQRVAADGSLGWAGQKAPRPFANSHDSESLPVACSDGKGGAIVAYQYEFATGEHKGDVDVVAQRVDASGKILWNRGETPVGVGASASREGRPAILSDGKGGAFIVFEWTDKDGDLDLLAQHVDGQGKVLWGEGKTPATVANSPKPERNPALVSDGKGGFLCVFEWQGDKGDTDLMAQRVTAEGKEAWLSNDQALDIAASDDVENHASVVSDGAGGALVAFEVTLVAGDYKGDHDVMAQHVSAGGKLLWNEGKAVPVCFSKGAERRPVAIADGAGGLVVACELEPTGAENAGDVDVVAQRVNADGELQWLEGKKSVAVASSKQIERAVSGVRSDDGSVILVFEMAYREGEAKGDVDLAAQRVGADGTLLWNKGEHSASVAASKWLERAGIVLSAGGGGAVIVYPDTGTDEKSKGDQDIEAAYLSRDGVLLWNGGKESVHLAESTDLERNATAVIVSGPGGQVQ